MATLTVSTKKIKVKPKPKPKILVRGIIKYIVLVLAVLGVNRGVSFHRSSTRKIFTLYNLVFILMSCYVTLYVSCFSPLLSSVTSFTRATAYSIFYYATVIIIMATSNKLNSIYTKINRVDYDLYVDSNKKLMTCVTWVFLFLVIGHEFQSLVMLLKSTFQGQPKIYVYYSLWYTFFVLHMELLWRYFVLKYVRIQLECVYKNLKSLQKSADYRNNYIYAKLSLQKFRYKNQPDKDVDADLVKIEKVYENILEIQHSMVSLLKPLFIINVLCSMTRALCDIYQCIKDVRSNPTLSYIVEEVILYLPLKLKTVILTLVICREFQLMAILDKKINIKLVGMLVDRNDKTSRKEILKFIHCIEINEKKFLLCRIIPLDMSLPWLCIVIILQFSVLVLQFLKALS